MFAGHPLGRPVVATLFPVYPNGMHMGRRNIKLPPEVFERHNQRRKEMGLSWESYIDGESPDETPGLSRDEVEEIVREQLRDFQTELFSQLR